MSPTLELLDLLDQMPCAVLVTDTEGRLLASNADLRALAAAPALVRVGEPMSGLFSAPSRIFLQTHCWPMLLRNGRLAEAFLLLRSAAEQVVPVLVNSRHGTYEGRESYFWTLFVATERQRFEAALLEARQRAEGAAQALAVSERFTRAVTDTIPDLVAYWDKDLRCRFANKAYQDWSGASAETLLGSHKGDLLNAAGYAANKVQIHAALGGQAQQFERLITTPDGQNKQFWARYVPDRVDGCVRGFLVVLSDVTHLKRTEAALREEIEARGAANEQLRHSSAALHQAQRLGRIGSWAWQLQGDVVTWSDELFNILGCDPAQGAPGYAAQAQIYQPESYARLTQAVNLALQTAEPYLLELAFTRPDGVQGWVEARGAVVRDAQGQVSGLQGTVQDITERRQLDQRLAMKTVELKRSNEELERFAYVASHDLQEPLRMVTSYGDLLMRRHLADLKPEAQTFMQFMVDGGQRAQALIRDLMSLARLDSQSQPWQPVPLQALVADVLKQLRLRVQETAAVVTVDELPVVLADARQMAQLMTNLLGNALKFCGDAPPQVHVFASRVAGAWCINVKDNGIGIEPRHFERIFQMFQRLHLRTAYEGTGIGLTICKKVVERHGGHIGVDSTPGAGSTFYFTLPDPVPAVLRTEQPADAVPTP